jgi:hypothetical protein
MIAGAHTYYKIINTLFQDSLSVLETLPYPLLIHLSFVAFAVDPVVGLIICKIY